MKKNVKLIVCIVLLAILTFVIVLKFTNKENTKKPDVTVMKQDLAELASVMRPIGSDGEAAAASYLKTRFGEMGYEVTLQSYTDAEGKIGTNVIAVRRADNPDADILVISAHHDSVPTAYGANDNASGVVALLAIADAVKDITTDTELRFISFTDEENGRNGSRYYTSVLTEEERDRIIGDIQLDMLGGLGTDGLSVCTMDGKANWLSDLVQKEDALMQLGAETASDHAAFQLAEIPSVLITQNGRGYLYHTVSDTVEHIDLSVLSHVAVTLSSVIRNIADAETTSYQSIAREQGNGYVYTHTRQNVIYFGVSLSESEAYIGAAGILADSRIEKGDFWEDRYDTYRYSMKWFGGQEPMNTYYCYRNGNLEYIEIKPEETGYTLEQIHTLLDNMYGAPVNTYTSEEGTVYEDWADEIYRKYIMLEAGDSCLITVVNYSRGFSNVLGSYQVENGNAVITDTVHAAVWDYLCSIIPADAREKIGEFNIFTDGCSNSLAYAATITKEDGSEDNSRFSINIDYYDVYDENGEKRDWSKLTYTIIHEYGHVLTENDTQIDLAVGKDVYDPAGFIDGSFRKNYYERFWKDEEGAGLISYKDDPTRYVRPYAAGYFYEDIADTFAVFVLGSKPEGNTVAEQKLLFFWDDSTMRNIRHAIRENLGLPV